MMKKKTASAMPLRPIQKRKAKAARKPKKTNNASAALDSEMSSGWQVLGGYGVQHAAVFHFEQPIDLTMASI
jgi:hypothetical protein